MFSSPLCGTECMGGDMPAFVPNIFCFAPGSSEVTNGFVSVAFGLAFALLLHAHPFFFKVNLQFLCVLLLEERYVQV